MYYAQSIVKKSMLHAIPVRFVYTKKTWLFGSRNVCASNNHVGECAQFSRKNVLEC